jgi:hypothetical protein
MQNNRVILSSCIYAVHAKVIYIEVIFKESTVRNDWADVGQQQFNQPSNRLTELTVSHELVVTSPDSWLALVGCHYQVMNSEDEKDLMFTVVICVVEPQVFRRYVTLRITGFVYFIHRLEF